MRGAAARRGVEEYFSFRVETRPEHLIVEWDADLGRDFLRAAMRVAQELRVQRRDPSFVDFVVRLVTQHSALRLLTALLVYIGFPAQLSKARAGP